MKKLILLALVGLANAGFAGTPVEAPKKIEVAGCSACGGTGVRPGTPPAPCPHCILIMTKCKNS